MFIGTVFVNNRAQAVRFPQEARLPDGIREVEVRVRGHERVISPLGQTWDSFFFGGAQVSEDFLLERADQRQSGRESL